MTTIASGEPPPWSGAVATRELETVEILRTGAGRLDQDAEFSAFAEAARGDLARTAWFLTGNEHLARELAQEALVRTYVAWPRARQGDPLAYARRVLANASIDLWRRRRREVLLAPDDVPDRATPPAGTVVEQRDELARALGTLSTKQRRVVVLRYFVGLTEREVADDLGVTIGTVKTQASRGLRTLRTILHETDWSAR